MDNKIRNTINRYDMLRKGDTVVVGLSGGADSVALLHILLSLREEYCLTLFACHINHNLRGEESDRDEAFVKNLCESLSVPLEAVSINVKEQVSPHESLEETARKLRYREFQRICTEKAAKLATAHTASDNAETVLINMLRGTGTKGLSGIPPVRDNIIRPLIRCSREEIEEYCEKNSLTFVTDSSNLTDDYTRNKIRHNIIPLLKEINPSFIGAAARMTAIVGDDADYLEECAAEKAKECLIDGKYDSKALKALPKALKCRIIASALKEKGVEPSTLRINQCEEIIEKGMGKVNLCKNRFAYVRKKKFYIAEEIQNYRNKTT